jgi:large subunit ribosomal protein L29
MNVEKIRNLTDAELLHQQRELSDQLFKMKFQLKMGQTESLKKIRELKKDIARIKTVARQKELAGGNGASAPKTPTAAMATSAPVKTKKAATKRAATEKK